MPLLSGLKFSKTAAATSPPVSAAHATESTTQRNPHRMTDATKSAGGLNMATGGLRGTFVPNDCGHRERIDGGSSLSKPEPVWCHDDNISMKRTSDGKSMAIGRGMSDKQVVSRFKRSVRDSIQMGGMGPNKVNIDEVLGSDEQQQFSALYEAEERISTSESKSKSSRVGGSNSNLVKPNDTPRYRESMSIDPTSAPPTSKNGVSTTNNSTTTSISSLPELVGSSSGLDGNASAAQALRARLSGRKRSQPMQVKVKETKEDSEGQVEIVAPHVADVRLRAVGGYHSKTCQKNNTESTTKAFLRKEIAMGPEDMDEVFTRNLLKMGNRYKGKELGSDSLLDEDAQLDTRMYEDHSSRLTELESKRRRILQAKREHAKNEATEKSCPLCMGSGSKFCKDIVASMGQKVMLLVETRYSIVKGHCILAPITHSESLVSCDEDVLHEIKAYKSCLLRMAENHGKSMVFMETAPRRILGGHARLECIPIPADVAHNVPLFFRQALSEAGDEWSTHKLIKLGSGGIRKAVPNKGFAYFSVEWSPCDGSSRGGGYAHIIEDQKKWSRSFGRDTIGAILKRDRLSNSITQSFQEFKEMWAPFNEANPHR